MQSKYSYSIIEELGLIIEYFEGFFDHKILKDIKEKIFNDIKFSDTYNTIADIRNASFCNYCDEDINSSQKYIQNVLDKLNYVTFLTDTPEQAVAVRLFYSGINFTKSNQFSIFTTLTSCLKHTGVDSNYYDIVKLEIEKLSGREELELQ